MTGENLTQAEAIEVLVATGVTQAEAQSATERAKRGGFASLAHISVYEADNAYSVRVNPLPGTPVKVTDFRQQLRANPKRALGTIAALAAVAFGGLLYLLNHPGILWAGSVAQVHNACQAVGPLAVGVSACSTAATAYTLLTCGIVVAVIVVIGCGIAALVIKNK